MAFLTKYSGVRMMTLLQVEDLQWKNSGGSLGVTLNISSFLAGKYQLSQEEVMESQTIAAVRIGVERAIQRIM